MRWVCPGKQPEEVVVYLSGPAKQEFDPDNIGFLVNARTGKATNRWADGTAGIPQGAVPFIEEEETAYHPETGEECRWVEGSHSPAGHVKGSDTITEEPKRIVERIKAEGAGILDPMRTWTTWFGFREYNLMAKLFSRLGQLGHIGWDEVNRLLWTDPPGELATKETLRHAYLTNWQYGGYMYDFMTPGGLPSWGSVSYADPEKVLKLAKEGGLKEIHLAGGYWEKLGEKGWGEKVSLEEAGKLLKRARETERLPLAGGHVRS